MSVGQCSKALREIWAHCCTIGTCFQVTVFHFHASPWWTRTIIERLVPAVSALLFTWWWVAIQRLVLVFIIDTTAGQFIAAESPCVKCVVLSAGTESCFKIRKWLALLSTCSGKIQKCILGTSPLMKVTERTLRCKAESCSFFFSIYSFCKTLCSGCSSTVLRLGYCCFRFYSHVVWYPKF